jgi:ubiquinone/menaquinone biosynthesis C-methylase UbiE
LIQTRTRGSALASGTQIPASRSSATNSNVAHATNATCFLNGENIMRKETNGGVTPKGHKGVGMEGLIATWYAWQTAKDMDRFRSTAHRLASLIKRNACVLEIAPGPGYLAIELAKLTGCRMVGVDISQTFVHLARDNARQAGLDIAFEWGDAADLPFPTDGFDLIVCCAAFKNFFRPLAALDEMHRVLKPGGTAVIIDLRKDFLPREVNNYVRGEGMINAAVIKLTFNTMLKKRAYTQEAIGRLVSQSQFRSGDMRLDSLSFELSLRKAE